MVRLSVLVGPCSSNPRTVRIQMASAAQSCLATLPRVRRPAGSEAQEKEERYWRSGKKRDAMLGVSDRCTFGSESFCNHLLLA